MVVQSEKDELIRQLDELGEDEIRLRLKANNVYGKWKKAYLESELERRDRARNDSSQSAQIDIARSAKDAAWAAADAAREANQHARTANIMAAIALIIAIIAAVRAFWVEPKTDEVSSAASAGSSSSTARSPSASPPASSSEQR